MEGKEGNAGVRFRIESSLLEQRKIQVHCNACLADYYIDLESPKGGFGLLESPDGEPFIIVSCLNCPEATTFFFSDHKDSEAFREFGRVIENQLVMRGGKAVTLKQILFHSK